MEHTHSHTHSHSHHHHHGGHGGEVSSGLKAAFWLNFLFALAEIVGGILTNSYAILSDALHDLGDTAAITMSFFLEKMALKKRDQNYTYGYKRLSLLAGFLSTIVLLAGSLGIMAGAVIKTIQPGKVDSEGMFVFAIVGLAANGIAFLRMEKTEKANVKAVKLHLLEDVLGWAAVIVGSILIYFTGFDRIDPILSLLISGYILFNAFRNLRSFTRIFLQGMPTGIVEEDLKQELQKIPGVQSLHDMHIWSMDGVYNIMSVHLVVHQSTTNDEIVRIRSAAREISRKFEIEHDTIEVGFSDENCEYVDC
ncbi:MAG: cation diffusion facilitator family transporter [Ignavibacteriales bacterium]|nr:MAG: cation transporter [Ignavibacteriaceae bacterium]MBW7872196.1 cation transporter [Ignavibacteria bacterium]MCZ2144009.1 cation diffusion facilitator family transporter [Ignavibacteriales bacterium]OQY73709.1 MAG: hypothetical protein B6D45_07745 [Ignavibacteriales bacterium UTCHB3]MBV6445658.1 Metal cation efflux system protein CzcD [Ignavibacteriaceae bacterium]